MLCKVMLTVAVLPMGKLPDQGFLAAVAFLVLDLLDCELDAHGRDIFRSAPFAENAVDDAQRQSPLPVEIRFLCHVRPP